MTELLLSVRDLEVTFRSQKKLIQAVRKVCFDVYEQEILGVVGTGKIGLNVIKIANGFGMKVIAHTKHPDEKLAKKCNFTYASYDELLKKSDVITFHVPLSNETKHMFNKSHLKLVKDGVVILNTARGSIVETESLLEGIKTKKISAVGLDVLENE